MPHFIETGTGTLIIMKIIRISIITFIIILICGCAPTTVEQRYKGMTSEGIYAGGEKALAKGRYDQASKYFEGLETLYPFGPYAEQGQLELIYSYYKNGDAASALAAADRFIHLYPQSNNVDYAFYMKGLVNFDRGRNWLQRKFKVSPAENDVSYLRQSFVDFNELVERFPDSKYSPDAQKRMIYIRNMLAQSELNAAQFYFRHKAYVAAVNRASNIVQHYQDSPQVIDALVIMVKANRALGLDKPANDALRTLQMNYPNARQLKKLN